MTSVFPEVKEIQAVIDPPTVQEGSFVLRVERFLWLVAVVGIMVYAGTLAEQSLAQAYLNFKLSEALDLPPRAVPPHVATPSSTETLGRLEIPSISLSAMFIEGVDGRTLRRAVGHIPGTALPGDSGNVGLSAHRDTFFRRLRKIHTNDVIWLTTLDGRYQYVVESSGVINPDEAAVLRDVGRPTLTLITCYPFYYVGSAPKRFFVHASLVTKSPQTSAPDPANAALRSQQKRDTSVLLR